MSQPHLTRFASTALLGLALGCGASSQTPRGDEQDPSSAGDGDEAMDEGESDGDALDDGDSPHDGGDGEEPSDGPCLDAVTLQIPAWGITNSGVFVHEGDVISIAATGMWEREGRELGAEGEGADCGGGLWLRVGKFHERKCVGKALDFSAERDGFLWFFQEGIAVGFDQQRGSLSVTISGGDSCSGQRPEGMLSVFDDPAFDLDRLKDFEPVCGNIPVLFDTDSPDDPAVKAYIADFLGGDPEAFLKKAVVVACAVNYATPKLAAHHGMGTMRLVHYLGAQKWEDLGRPAHKGPNGEEYWDFALSFKPEELSDLQHYGRWGAVADTLLHETGHVMSPIGRVEGMPRWLNETYADFLSAKMGALAPSTDNPENWVLYGRQAPYCDGYGTGVLFLDALDRRFPGFIHELSARILEVNNDWPGSAQVFEELTGVPLAKLYDDYVSGYELTLKKPVSECEFPE
jgi:hypothetical protein